MEYAVIEVGGKQYRVVPGQTLDVDSLKGEKGSIFFDKVLLHVAGEEVAIGAPYLANATVTAKIINDFRGKKLRVARFTAKSRHRRVVGFRAALTRIQIEKITNGTKAAEKTVKTKKA